MLPGKGEREKRGKKGFWGVDIYGLSVSSSSRGRKDEKTVALFTEEKLSLRKTFKEDKRKTVPLGAEDVDQKKLVAASPLKEEGDDGRGKVPPRAKKRRTANTKNQSDPLNSPQRQDEVKEKCAKRGQRAAESRRETEGALES